MSDILIWTLVAIVGSALFNIMVIPALCGLSSHESGAIKGEMTRWLALLPIALYGLYIFVQYQDTLDHEADADKSGIVDWVPSLPPT